MPIPNGNGSEVLKVSLKQQTSGNAEMKLIDGETDHIYTVLSISMTNTNGSPSNINLFIADNAGANANERYYLLKVHAMNGHETFVWSDKIVLLETDELFFQTELTEAFDVVTSYIDQDWDAS